MTTVEARFDRSDIPTDVPTAESFELKTSPLVLETINQRVGQVYAYTALGLAIAAASAAVCSMSGFAVTLLSAIVSTPWLTTVALIAVGVSLIAAIRLTSKENSLQKQGLYGLFSVFEGFVISPLAYLNPVAFASATITTVVVTGGLGLLSMRIKESFERYEKILMVGLGAIALASLGSLCLSGMTAAIAHEISYVGGFALFSAFIIHDTHKARSEAAKPQFDAIDHATEIFLDALNLLIRFWGRKAQRN